MREALGFGGNLPLLNEAERDGRALPGVNAITSVRNHDIERGQTADRESEDRNGRSAFGVGWKGGEHRLKRTDLISACAFLLGGFASEVRIFWDV
jgi:hypothetical protein